MPTTPYLDSQTLRREERRIAERKVKKVYEIPKRSGKLKKEEQVHAKIKKQFLIDHPFCECKRLECKGGKAVDLHHLKGRGIYLNDPRYFLAMSRECHNWIKENSKEALELGLIVSRLIK